MQNLKEYLPTKKVTLLVIMLVLIAIYALGQGEKTKKKNKSSFIRIYRLDGKINRGKLILVSDSLFILKMNHDGESVMDSIGYKKIAFVRKGRSMLHHFVVKGIIGFGIVLPILAVGQGKANTTVNVTNNIIGAQAMPEPESHVFSNSLKAGLLVGLISALIHAPNQRKLRIDGSLEKFKVVSRTVH